LIRGQAGERGPPSADIPLSLAEAERLRQSLLVDAGRGDLLKTMLSKILRLALVRRACRLQTARTEICSIFRVNAMFLIGPCGACVPLGASWSENFTPPGDLPSSPNAVSKDVNTLDF
jgi:hypothetical protein